MYITGFLIMAFISVICALIAIFASVWYLAVASNQPENQGKEITVLGAVACIYSFLILLILLPYASYNLAFFFENTNLLFLAAISPLFASIGPIVCRNVFKSLWVKT